MRKVDEKGLARDLRKAMQRAMEGAGTLPAKESVKVRPADWPKDSEIGLNDLSLGTLLSETRKDAAKAAPESGVPVGWRLVPVEPDDKMMLMGGFRFAGRVPNSEVFKEVRRGWDDMLSAAPSPGETK